VDEGCVSVELERRLEVAVQGSQAAASGGGGELADQSAATRSPATAIVCSRAGQRLVGEVFGVPARDTPGAHDVLDRRRRPARRISAGVT
jgi:hypothetical protein